MSLSSRRNVAQPAAMRHAIRIPDFEPVILSADDELPVNLRLLLRYATAPEPEAFAVAMEQALRAFPHLTGVRSGDRIIPSPAGAKIAWDDTDTPESSVRTTFAELSRRYFLTGESECEMFSAQVTRHLPEGSAWLGLSVSHRALDGTGLGWFFAHLGAALHGAQAPPVRHDRACTEVPRDGAAGIPEGYGDLRVASESLARELAMAAEALVVFVPSAELERRFGTLSQVHSRFALTAWLCAEVTAADPALDRVALWCNARARRLVPLEYTGNAGCYSPFAHDRPIAEQLQALTRREGAARIAATYRAVKGSPSPIGWNGFAEGFIQCNLIAAPSSVADLGRGRPSWGALLSRNSAGLRIAPAADGTGWIVECSFAAPVLERLRERLPAAFPHTAFWNGGTS
jgi:hypothetical protein